MRNWSPASPLLARHPLPRNPQDVLAELDGWSIAELLRGERFEPPTPDAPLAPPPSVGARAEPATTASQPAWLANAQWQATPGSASWPEMPPIPRSAISDDPFERAAIRTRRPTPRRSPMGPPFLNQPPSDYPSHLGPVPRVPDWEEVVPGPIPRSPLAEPPRATDWGKTSPASNAAARKTANTSVALRREGGVSTTCRPKVFPPISVRASRPTTPTMSWCQAGVAARGPALSETRLQGHTGALRRRRPKERQIRQFHHMSSFCSIWPI
jgi:hypothetical protein